MRLRLIPIFAGFIIFVFGVTFMSTYSGIERITLGLPLVVSGMVITGIAAMLKSKTLKDFPL